MANVIKHKRGSGSDPSASDLVVGEVAIRTDTGKLFTKMDNGSVAEIAGGGSDIAINTLSSSSGTGGGSATFNGSAYRFTLSSPPSVSAQQLLVSINGVIQKPVAGTGQPSEGFSVDGNDIILGDAPATGADFFIVTFKSLGVSEPADNSVTSAKIADGTIVNADINASAAIAGTKIAPNFGSQNISTTGNVGIGTTSPDGKLDVRGTIFVNGDGTGGRIFASSGNLSLSDGNGRQVLRIDDPGAGNSHAHIFDSNGRLGIGTTSPSVSLDIESTTPTIRLTDSDASGTPECEIKGGGGDLVLSADRDNEKASTLMQFQTDGSTAMTIDSSQQVGIGTESPRNITGYKGLTLNHATHGGFIQFQEDGTNTSHVLGGPNSLDVSTQTSIPIYLKTAGDNVRMTIASDGNVGIGTTSPASLLTLNHATNPAIQFQDSGTKVMGINAEGSFANIASHEGKALRFATNSGSGFTSAMVIDTSQQVGIGTESPGVKLDILQSSATQYSQTGAPSNTIARFYNAQAQDDSHTAIQLRASNDNGAADLWYITCVSHSQNYNGSLTFTARTTSSAYQELVRFANNGRVSMQVLALGSGNSHDSAKLVIQGSGNTSSTNVVFFKNSDETPVLQLRNDGLFLTGVDGASPYNLTTSDAANCNIASSGALRRSTSSVRFKKDIADATFGLADVLKLKPKTFKNNATGEFADDKTYAGFTAEDIHDLGLTEFVQYNENNEPDALAYGNMVALMAKAIQDLNAKVEALEAG